MSKEKEVKKWHVFSKFALSASMGDSETHVDTFEEAKQIALEKTKEFGETRYIVEMHSKVKVVKPVVETEFVKIN